MFALLYKSVRSFGTEDLEEVSKLEKIVNNKVKLQQFVLGVTFFSSYQVGHPIIHIMDV